MMPHFFFCNPEHFGLILIVCNCLTFHSQYKTSQGEEEGFSITKANDGLYKMAKAKEKVTKTKTFSFIIWIEKLFKQFFG